MDADPDSDAPLELTMRHLLASIDQQKSRAHAASLQQHRKAIQVQRYLASFMQPLLAPTPFPIDRLRPGPLAPNKDYQELVARLNKYNEECGRATGESQELKTYKLKYYGMLQHTLHSVGELSDRNMAQEQVRKLRLWSDGVELKIVKGIGSRPFVPYCNYILKNDLDPEPAEDELDATRGTDSFEDRLPSTLRDALLQDFKDKKRTLNEHSFTPAERLARCNRKKFNIIQELVEPVAEAYPRTILNCDFTVPADPPKEEEPAEGEEAPPAPLGEEEAGGVPDPQADAGPDEEGEEQKKEDESGLNRLCPHYKPFTERFRHKGKKVEAPGAALAQQVMRKRAVEEDNRKQEEQNFTKIKLKWASYRARFLKEGARRMEIKLLKPQSEDLPQPQPAPQQFSQQDEQRFFPQKFQARKKPFPVRDLSLGNSRADLSTDLPALSNRSMITDLQKNVARKRINSMRKEYGSLIGVSHEEEQNDDEKKKPPRSLCQHSGRFKAFSEILRENSLSREREEQINEVSAIKERLSKRRVFLNGRALAEGLCLPMAAETERALPSIDLPSNPFDEPPKKKKK